MEAKDVILGRRSVRKFKDTEVSEELILKLVEAADNAPSACNRRPVDFYVIRNRDILARLSESGRFTGMSSPLAIVIVGDLSRALPHKYRDYWIHDAAAATENILLMATDLGLGSCWCGVHPQESVMARVKEIISLPEDKIPFSLVRIGYPDEFPEPHAGFCAERVKFID